MGSPAPAHHADHADGADLSYGRKGVRDVLVNNYETTIDADHEEGDHLQSNYGNAENVEMDYNHSGVEGNTLEIEDEMGNSHILDHRTGVYDHGAQETDFWKEMASNNAAVGESSHMKENHIDLLMDL